MDFKETRKIGRDISEWVTYNGFNLWHLAEAGIYNTMLKDKVEFSIVDKQKHKAMRFFINVQNKKRESEKLLIPKTNNDVLAVVQGTSQVKTILPLLKGKFTYKIIRYDSPSDDSSKKTLESLGEEYVNLESYMNDEAKKRIKKGEAWMNESWKKINSDPKLKVVLGNNYEKVLDILEYCFKTRRRFLEIIRYIELYNEVFIQEKIKLVFVSDDVNVVGRLACMIAKKQGIPSLDIQHGQLQGNPTGEITADKMIVNGKGDKKHLILHGANPDQLIVTGQPRFDAVVDKLKLSKKEICDKYGLDPSKKIIVYSYQKPVPEENIVVSAKKCFLDNFSKIKNSSDLQFVVTMRLDTPIPSDLQRDEIKLLPGADIQELAVCSEILLTAYSTAAVEYVLMGKPVMAINLGAGEEEYIDYTKLGVGFKIVNEAEFLPSIERALFNVDFVKKFKQSRSEFITDFNYKLDGNAKTRCLKVISNMIK
jgi:hypothetical protein